MPSFAQRLFPLLNFPSIVASFIGGCDGFKISANFAQDLQLRQDRLCGCTSPLFIGLFWPFRYNIKLLFVNAYASFGFVMRAAEVERKDNFLGLGHIDTGLSQLFNL